MQREFDLDQNILGAGASEKVIIGGATDADVLDALVSGKPFPKRPNGKIELGRIDIQAQTGKAFTFKAGNQGSVSFSPSAGFRTGLGVYDKPADAMSAFQFDAPPGLDLSLGAPADSRFVVFLWGYDAAGSFSGSHPIGALGKVTFGVDGKYNGVYGVIHRIASDTHAAAALADTFANWRLPRHVDGPGKLKPASWVVAEADGSLAIKVAAQLGYDLSFTRSVKGLPRDLSAKIDAAVSATFGFDMSGKYVVVVGCESDESVARLRLFKQASKGLKFALNLNVGVQGDPGLPDKPEDLIQSVFGVHGQQVVKDLQILEQWTGPNADLGQNVAGLLTKTARDLVQTATGMNVDDRFIEAKKKLLDALGAYDSLPERASAALWKWLGKMDQTATNDFKTFLCALADPDQEKRADALAQALHSAVFGGHPGTEWLEGIADQGLLALSGQLGFVSAKAQQTLDILNGGVIKRLQDFINKKLHLGQIEDAVKSADPSKVDDWLKQRLGSFLDKQVGLGELRDVQNALHALDTKARDFYAKGLQALRKKYTADLAATYSSTVSGSALIDATFDLSNSEALDTFKAVVGGSNFDRLLTRRNEKVTIAQAVLTHSLKRSAAVDVHLPAFDFSQTHVTDALATLNVEEHAAGILAYSFQGMDAIKRLTSRQRMASQLSIAGNIKVSNGTVTLAGGGAIAYESRYTARQMNLGDFQVRVTPFIRAYLMNQFANDGAMDTFFMDFDRAVTHSQSNNLGDCAISMQVSIPASLLADWLAPLAGISLKQAKNSVSRQIQRRLRQVVPFYYLDDVGELRQNESISALLVWSSLPVTTNVHWDHNAGILGGLNKDDKPFWDIFDSQLRKAMENHPNTQGALQNAMSDARRRLLAAGDSHNAGFFLPGAAGRFFELAQNNMGDTLLLSLLQAEKNLIGGVCDAIDDMQKFRAVAATAPVKAKDRLTDFAADLASAFHEKVKSVYSGDWIRSLGSVLLVECTAALGGAAQSPSAMLTIYAMLPNQTADLTAFVDGTLPPKEHVGVAQALVNV